tara:strand:- start:17700 stop:18161 length:462 start_codon:yes stop_codon:yes gene_type:complete
MALTKYLRDTADARFTNKAAKITNAEYDSTLRSFHDDVDALTASIAAITNGVLNEVQETDTDVTWDGTSSSVHCETDAGVMGITLSTVSAGVIGTRVHIMDKNGDASTSNITVSGQGGELINGAASLVMNTNWESVTLEAILDAGVVAWMIVN